jgi:hypothetical protein
MPQNSAKLISIKILNCKNMYWHGAKIYNEKEKFFLKLARKY